MKTATTLLVLVTLALFSGCKKDAKEEAHEAVKELKQGDVKQATEEAGEAMGTAAKEAGDKIKDATH